MRSARIARGVLLGAGLAWGAPALVASCDDSTGLSPVGVGHDSDASDATPARPADAANAADATDAPADKALADVPHCPPPPNIAARCTGADSRVVFFPPVACDPSTIDASAQPADAGADAATGPCDGVSRADVSFTPKACQAFADRETNDTVSYEQNTRAPSFVEPSDGSALTPDAWSIFAWKKGPDARLPARGGLREWLEPSAYALTPLSGDGYVLEFKQGCTEVLRTMTASTFWAPDAASWALLTATQGPVTVRVYWMKFTADGLVSGPIASDPITITMQH